MSQTRRAAQTHGAVVEPEHDGHVTVHVAALADGHAVEAAETEEARLAAELVHHTLLDDLPVALQNFWDNRWRFIDFAKRKKNYFPDFSSSYSLVLTMQFLQHMLHLVIGVTGTVCCIPHVTSDEVDDGATPLVESGSSS